MIHIVTQGDTLETIANQYGVSPDRIVYDNQLPSPMNLVLGQALLILIPNTIHEVSQGENLETIAASYNMTVKQLKRNNPFLLQNETVTPGEYLVISYEGEKIGSLKVGGYAYTYINQAILQEALLYIDELLVFSYGYTEEGVVIPPENPSRLVEEARKNEVSPILVLTPSTSQGTFDNQLVKKLSEDLNLQQTLIQNLLLTVQQEGYDGVDVDFEYILPESREGYAGFVRSLTTIMNENGYRVSVALAPKVAADQPGLLYEGVDYGLLGESANSVFLMTYEWGYTYGPPMAVAPINKVKQVLDYAITAISPDKISMGIPNYGYDWPLPYERGVTRARSIGNVQAIEIAAAQGATIQFDQTAMSPYFTYEENGVTHEVWFEDVRSIEEKVRVALSYGFMGIGYWNLMRRFRSNWLLLHWLLRLS